MNININENTKLKTGTITVEGRRLNYLITIEFCQRRRYYGDRPKLDAWYEVELVLFNGSFGRVEGAMSRQYSVDECPSTARACKAILVEYKTDVAA